MPNMDQDPLPRAGRGLQHTALSGARCSLVISGGESKVTSCLVLTVSCAPGLGVQMPCAVYSQQSEVRLLCDRSNDRESNSTTGGIRCLRTLVFQKRPTGLLQFPPRTIPRFPDTFAFFLVPLQWLHESQNMLARGTDPKASFGKRASGEDKEKRGGGAYRSENPPPPPEPVCTPRFFLDVRGVQWAGGGVFWADNLFHVRGSQQITLCSSYD